MSTKKQFNGSVVYFHRHSLPTDERSASLVVAYTLEATRLSGQIRFNGCQTWESTFTVDGVFHKLPELWKLKELARVHLCRCMANRFYVHRSISFGN